MSEQPQQQFSIQRFYLKHTSFEAPSTPDIFTRKWKSNINVEIKTQHKQIDDKHHEVVLQVKVESKHQDDTAYLVQVQQAGLFLLQGFNQRQMGHMLGARCPNMLFPYVRETISSLVGKGGFPEMQLAPINFDVLYSQHLQQQTNEPSPVVTH